MSSYVYDETSRYYYDSQTSLYYDPSSTYYYNSKTNSYFYWSQEHHTYLPSGTDESQSGKNSAEDGDKKKEDKKDKVKTAKKIAKDMEKWAKTLNQRKEAAKVSQPSSISAPSAGASRGGGLEDLAFSMFQKQSAPPAGKPVQAAAAAAVAASKTEAQAVPPSGLAGLANYGSDSDNDDQVKIRIMSQ